MDPMCDEGWAIFGRRKNHEPDSSNLLVRCILCQNGVADGDLYCSHWPVDPLSLPYWFKEILLDRTGRWMPVCMECAKEVVRRVLEQEEKL